MKRGNSGPSGPAQPLAAASPETPLITVEWPGPPGAPVVLLLHATLATAASLNPLAIALSVDARVIGPDRRGSGRSLLLPARPLRVADHVADVVRVLDDAGVELAVAVGHSFGGVVGLELAARHPDRVSAVLAWEPPYLALADDPTREHFDGLPDRIEAAHAAGGAPAAAAVFFDAVNGRGAFERLPARAQAAVAAAGDGALADASMPDLDPEGLARIVVPVVLATGGRGDAVYDPIVAALAQRIPTARRVELPGLAHMAPMTEAAPIAALIRELLGELATLEPTR